MKRFYMVDGKMLEEKDSPVEFQNFMAGWAGYSDAEEEIEKARREGISEGEAKGWEGSDPDRIRADERERIRGKYHQLRSDHLAAESAEIAMADPAQEPKPLEKLNPETKVGGRVVEYEVVHTVNALVDAVNDLRRRK